MPALRLATSAAWLTLNVGLRHLKMVLGPRMRPATMSRLFGNARIWALICLS